MIFAIEYLPKRIRTVSKCLNNAPYITSLSVNQKTFEHIIAG